MNNKRKLMALVAAFALLLGGAYVLYDRLGGEAAPEQMAAQEAQPGKEQPGEETEKELPMAPDFTVYDGDGNEVRLSDFTGKPVVLNFWASWCGPCKMEMPDFHEAYLELGEEVQFLMLNVTGGRETQESAASFIEKQGYTFPVFYDLDGTAAGAYGAYGLPTTYFIDEAGHAMARATGAIDGATLMQGIEMILPSTEEQ